MIAPEEMDNDKETKTAVIWDFELAAGITAAVFTVKPVEKGADGLVIMQRLNFQSVSCNCTVSLHRRCSHYSRNGNRR